MQVESVHFAALQSPGYGADMTRREFLGFFLLGGFLSLLGKKTIGKKITIVKNQKEAMFWKKAN